MASLIQCLASPMAVINKQKDKELNRYHKTPDTKPYHIILKIKIKKEK